MLVLKVTAHGVALTLEIHLKVSGLIWGNKAKVSIYEDIVLHGSPTSEGRLFHKKKKKIETKLAVWESMRGSSRKKKAKNVQKEVIFYT